jgi:hypothetical protein
MVLCSPKSGQHTLLNSRAEGEKKKERKKGVLTLTYPLSWGWMNPPSSKSDALLNRLGLCLNLDGSYDEITVIADVWESMYFGGRLLGIFIWLLFYSDEFVWRV